MDLLNATDGREPPVLTVSALTGLIKETLETCFPDVLVVGQLSRVTRAASGHVYLTLKDERAVLQCVMWRQMAAKLKFELAEGLEVLARGHVEVYAPRGSYQLIVQRLEPRGVGALELAFRQLKARLEAEGLFRSEAKKPLPAFPGRIGIVTSPTGAAIRDIINVFSRRFPLVELFLFPSRVQGDGAAAEIAKGIEMLNRFRPDLELLIVGRGGGSLEDLWPFNEEVVARAIYASRIPVISAVGHETDLSIADYVADVRAATPTEAAEIAAPDRRDLGERVRRSAERMAAALRGVTTRARQDLRAAASRYVFRHPEALWKERTQRADEVFEALKNAIDRKLDFIRQDLAAVNGRLEALSPLKVLERGYSITFDAEGRILRGVETLAEGDTVVSRILGGKIRSRIEETLEIPHPVRSEKKNEN